MILMMNGCNQQAVADNKQAEMDSLRIIINQLKPGLGEFMQR
jgi:hypothetical protein